MVKSSGKEIATLKKKVALGNRIVFHQGLGDYHGHVSARIPRTRKFLIKPMLVPLGTVRGGDILTVDIDEYKRVCEENWAKSHKKRAVTRIKVPPRETMIHAAIYESRSEVNSVVHTHQPLATAFSVAGVPILPIYNQATPFAPETPIFPSPRLIYTVRDGAELCQALGDRMALLLQGHGVVVVGDTIEYATAHAVYLERTARIQWVASCLGKPTTMPQKDIDHMKENMIYRSYDAFAYFASVLPGRKKR